MDLPLPKLSGVECARQFKARLPSLKILVLTKHENAELIFQALRAGADGYVLKRKLPQLRPEKGKNRGSIRVLSVAE